VQQEPYSPSEITSRLSKHVLFFILLFLGGSFFLSGSVSNPNKVFNSDNIIIIPGKKLSHDLFFGARRPLRSPEELGLGLGRHRVAVPQFWQQHQQFQRFNQVLKHFRTLKKDCGINQQNPQKKFRYYHGTMYLYTLRQTEMVQ
jgi:hypothetical protein